MADQLVSMLGIPSDQAAALLEAAGGSVELAMNLHFGGGDAFDEPTGGGSSGFKKPFDWYTLVWPEEKEIPDSWLQQDLVFCKDKDCRVGLVQKRNGPCGMLAIIQSYIFDTLIEKYGKVNINEEPSDEIISIAISKCLQVSASKTVTPDSIKLVSWKDSLGGDINTTEIKLSDLLPAVSSRINDYKSPGGIILVMYSGLLSRGIDLVKNDIDSDVGEPPLVLAPCFICSSELFGLFFRGIGGGNTSSYTVTGEKQDWESKIGILSVLEQETGVPLADSLKSPPRPIWIVHGGDHFTVMFMQPDEMSLSKFSVWHWNGLPPSGPDMSQLVVEAPNGNCKPAPEKHTDKFKKPVVGTIYDIVQTTEEDKKNKPGKYKDWTYEAVLAIDDPEVSGEPETPSEDNPVFLTPPTGPWRCASCYHSRFKTMCFGLNDDTPNCKFCNRPRQEALWSLWLHYDQLPKQAQNLATKMFAPKIHVLLTTKWPGCSFIGDPEEAPSI